jgi:hypothetical protein
MGNVSNQLITDHADYCLQLNTLLPEETRTDRLFRAVSIKNHVFLSRK